MALCYWGLCTCPDHEPCAQHAGFGCGFWNGIPIQDPTQVDDALTRDAELAIVSLDADKDEVRTMRAQLEQKRADLERERAQIESVLHGPSSMSQRRQTARQIERAYGRIGQIRAEARQTMTDLDSINARSSSAGAMIAMSLIIPYTSASGYCACYDTKRGRLAAIASEIARQQAMLTPLLTRKNAIRQQIFGTFSALPTRPTILRMLGSITFFVAVVAFILFNAATAAIAAILGLLLIAFVVYDMLFDLIDINAQILVIRQNIVRLNLAYYRMQSIATCRAVPLEENEDDDTWYDENRWYREAVPEYTTPPEPEDS